MVSLYRDPLGERIFSDQDTPTKNDCEAMEATNRLLELEARIQLLEEIIKNTSRSKVSCLYAEKMCNSITDTIYIGRMD